MSKSKVCKTILERIEEINSRAEERDNRILTPNIMEEVRSGMGVSQVVIAGDLGVAINAYRQWEEGTFYPSEKNYKKLQRYFCIFDEEDINKALAATLHNRQQGVEL